MRRHIENGVSALESGIGIKKMNKRIEGLRENSDYSEKILGVPEVG